MSFSDLHDPVLLHVASFLSAEDLCSFESLNRHLRRLDYESTDIWYQLCCQRWSSYPKYRRISSPSLSSSSSSPSSLSHRQEQRRYYEQEHVELSALETWKLRYIWMVNEMKRTHITVEELQSLNWWFNFTPSAGGRGDETLCRVQFIQGFLFVPQFLPMPFRLVVEENEEDDNRGGDSDDDNSDNNGRRRQRRRRRQQYLHVYAFPPHRIDRLTESGEWLIMNDNVTFVSSSCDDDHARPTYTDRGFQTLRETAPRNDSPLR